MGLMVISYGRRIRLLGLDQLIRDMYERCVRVRDIQNVGRSLEVCRASCPSYFVMTACLLYDCGAACAELPVIVFELLKAGLTTKKPVFRPSRPAVKCTRLFD